MKIENIRYIRAQIENIFEYIPYREMSCIRSKGMQ